MTPIVACLIYAATVTVAAPQILTRGRWQVWQPRLALACWHAALASVAGALLFAAIYGMALAHSLGLDGRGGKALVFSFGAWAGAFVLAACCALLSGRSEPVVRHEQGVKDHLRYAARTCRHSVENRSGTTIRYVDADSPVAYSFHAPEATVVISRTLQDHLTEPELDAVIAHECAHLEERHHLVLRLANVYTACLPRFAPVRRLKKSTKFLVELIADDVAAAKCGSHATASALSVMAQLAARPDMALRAERLHSRAIGGQHSRASTGTAGRPLVGLARSGSTTRRHR
ncbi:M56 family metallopeptidase [Enemella sp. A6]|uniref:M56 family metallopeptidase n=1 Tax=Enemella sp. A6 TaxID=3440152 RepID=UPI003EBED553